MPLDQTTGDRQPKPGALALLAVLRHHLAERSEYLGDVVGRYTDAGVSCAARPALRSSIASMAVVPGVHAGRRSSELAWMRPPEPPSPPRTRRVHVIDEP